MKVSDWLAIAVLIAIVGKAIVEWLLFKSKRRLAWDFVLCIAVAALLFFNRRGS